MINDLALQRDKYKHLSDAEWRWMLQQVEGRERTADKLPSFAAIQDWWYPVRLSCEQCSSEATARYKAQICQPAGRSLLDLTGGYGVDTWFLSRLFDHTDYVEQDTELCRIAAHNFALPCTEKGEASSITVHNCTAEEFLSLPLRGGAGGGYSLIFLDPARRDSHGSKVFRLGDCTPDVTALLPTLLEHLAPGGRILLKLSPMLDLTQAVKELSAVSWDIHVVALKNEVKEVLLFSRPATLPPSMGESKGAITAVDLAHPGQAFTFTKEEEQAASFSPFTGEWEGAFLYEPSAAILKAGAYKLPASRFGLRKLDVNTHLYCSETLVENFPGRIWRIQSPITNHKLPITQANVLTRNYPLTAEQLKKKLHLRDGGTAFVIGCRLSGKPALFYAERYAN